MIVTLRRLPVVSFGFRMPTLKHRKIAKISERTETVLMRAWYVSDAYPNGIKKDAKKI
jgi:hypothetical protein